MTRSAKSHRYAIPSRDDIESIYQDLLIDKRTLEEVSEWASEYILYEDPQIYPPVEDMIVWNAIVNLYGSDAKLDPDTYLHRKENIKQWLKNFRKQCAM